MDVDAWSEDADDHLFAALGITAAAQQDVEQAVLDQALTAANAAATGAAEDGTAEGLAQQLLAVEQEADTISAALAAAQQQEDQVEDGIEDASVDEVSKAAARSNRQLEAAVMRQRLDHLQQQQHLLHQQLAALPPDQQQLAAHHQQHLQQQLQQQQQQARDQRGRGRGRAGSGRGGRGRGRRGPAAAAGGQEQPGWLDEPAAVADADAGADAEAGVQVAFVETERDRLIRCGLLTPFDKLDGFDMQVQGAAPPQQPQPPQQPPQQQTLAPPGVQHTGLPGSTSSSGRRRAARDAAAPVDEQWALLMRNAVPAGATAAAAVPSEVADLANQVGRGGLPLSELLAKAAQQTVEVGITNRPRAILMEPEEVPKQERDIIKVNPMLWRANAPAQRLPGAAAKRPKRASTLPRQKRRRHGASELRLMSEAGPDGLAASGAGGSRKRRRKSQAGQGSAGGGSGGDSSGSSAWEEDWESSGGEEEEGEEALLLQQEQAEEQQQQQPSEHTAAAAAAAAAGGGGDSGGAVQQRVQTVSGSGSDVDAAAVAGSDDEYLPSDVDMSKRRRRRGGSSQPSRGNTTLGESAAAAAAAAGGAGDNSAADMAGLVPERHRAGGPDSSSSGRGAGRGRGQKQRGQGAAGAQQRPRKGRQRQRSRSAAAAAAGDGAADGARSPSAVSSSEEEDVLLAQADAVEELRDELADYDDLDDTVYELRMQRYQEQLQSQAAQQAQQQPQQPQQPLHQPASGDTHAGGTTAATAADAAAPSAAAAAAAAAEGGDGGGDAGADAVFEGGFSVPGTIWSALFGYQRTGVKWLWELHNQRAGGIIGDEMGLGKTIQVIAYFAGLHSSGMWQPTLVVAPATVLRQWMTELRTWYPPLRVYMLHDSGRSPPGSARPDKAGLLDAALSHDDCSLVLTTYEALRLQRELLLPVRWGVAVLDEGHKIRNPDAEVTLAAKQLQTVHRVIMSGSPIQNRLSELWSLFDFIFPGKLGTLPVFTAQFAIPITIGGYTNASKLQVQMAYRCAVVLRDLISPYLLRRRKADVATQLPKKTETVLFCSLTETQRDLYRAYLSSSDVSEILSGQRQALAGIDVLRKICNHPDLLQRTQAQGSITYGEPNRSGKLQVLVKVLAAWRAEGHKVLLFTQTQQMLDIIEKHVVEAGYSYHRMDGNTAIATRGRLMDEFNSNPDRFLFLLTTKVGGLGVNLTGANRVLIYDPDWNPSTDSQARERAWRIGQGRPVTIYRLITSGTIEEKVYHRQIYKSYLTNKVLQDPRQRRFFASRDITDLFTLADEHGGTGGTKRGGASTAAAAQQLGPAAATETGRIFSDVVREQKLPTPPAGAAAAPRGRHRQQHRSTGAAAGGISGAAVSQKGRRSGSSKPTSAVQQQQQEAGDGSGSPPLSPTARATIGLAVLAPAADADALSAPTGADAAAAAAAGVCSAAGAAAAGSNAAKGGSNADDGDDAKVLRDLFEGVGGLKSLMDHTSIEGAHDPEARQADIAAVKLAEQAAEKLRESRLACQGAAVHVPTWTGRHGAAGLQGAASRGGGGSRRSSPMRPGGSAAAAAAAGGSSAGRAGGGAAAAAGAAPRGRFGQVVNPLLTLRPLYAAAQSAAAGVGPGSRASPGRAGRDGDGSNAGSSAAEGSGSEGAADRVHGSGPQESGVEAGRAFSGQLAGATGGAAPSSAALLAQLRQRQANIAAAAADAGRPASRRFGRGAGGGGGVATADAPSLPAAAATAAGGSAGGGRGEGEDAAAAALASEVAAFIQAAGGSLSSDALVSHFGGKLLPSEMPLFKQVLRQVARLQPGAPGRSKVWVLKPDDAAQQ